jgi:hypothetical protein
MTVEHSQQGFHRQREYIREAFTLEEKQQTRVPVTDEIVGAAPIGSVSTKIKLELTGYNVLVEDKNSNGDNA